MDEPIATKGFSKLIQFIFIRCLQILLNGLHGAFALMFSTVILFEVASLLVHWLLSLYIDVVFNKLVFGLEPCVTDIMIHTFIRFLFSTSNVNFRFKPCPIHKIGYFMQMGAVAWKWTVICDNATGLTCIRYVFK